MKTILTSLVIFVTITLSAQNSFGLMAGLSTSNTIYSSESHETEYGTSFELGYMGGLGFDRVLCESFTFAIHGRYTRARSSISGVIANHNLKIEMDVIDIPVQIKYRFGTTKLNLAVGAGPSLAKISGLEYRWNVSSMIGMVTDFKNFNFGIDANFLFKDITQIYFTDQNGIAIGNSGQNLFFINVFGKYSIPF